jgi:bacterioferritin (cytochrome b1)
MADEFDQYKVQQKDEFDQYKVKPSEELEKAPGFLKRTGKGAAGMATAGASGFNVGASNVLGMPVDIVNKLLSIPGFSTQQPVLGSEWIKQNVMPAPVQPQGAMQTMAGAVGEQVPNAMSMALLPGGAKIAEMLKYALGAGLGSGTARTVAPGNRWVDLAGQLLGGAGIPAAKAGVEALTRSGTVEKAVETGITKGVRPSVVGKSTATQAEQYMQRAQTAVEKIVENKPNLQFMDETGQIVKGQLPKNLKEFSQAVDQTKKSIFTQYDAMAQQAGQKTATVKLKPISQELDQISQNTALNDIAPGVADYAAHQSQRFLLRQEYTTSEAQEAIAMLNNRLEAFYKNPSYDTASKAYIDSMIANRLRAGLDSTIEGAVGAGYQQLKNQYGALKTIEKDVTHRSIVDARKNVKGLLDFSDIYSGYHVIQGILSMHPSSVAAGGAAKTISWLYKLRNDPNKIVNTMFGNVERLSQPATGAISPLGKAALPSSMNLVEGLQGGGW